MKVKDVIQKMMISSKTKIQILREGDIIYDGELNAKTDYDIQRKYGALTIGLMDIDGGLTIYTK